MEIGRGFGGMLPGENFDFSDLHVCILRLINEIQISGQ